MIFLSDGERALHDRQSEYLPENTICILDLFHVLERLWKVAWCFFEEGTQKREAHQWVEERLKRLLEGKVDSVIREPAVPGHPAWFEGAEAENRLGRGGIFREEPGSDEVRRILGGRLPDWQWGRRGSMSASGQGSDGAYGDALDSVRRQAMLDLRGTYLNGEWNAFWKFHVEREDQRLYGKIRGRGMRLTQ